MEIKARRHNQPQEVGEGWHSQWHIEQADEGGQSIGNSTERTARPRAKVPTSLLDRTVRRSWRCSLLSVNLRGQVTVTVSWEKEYSTHTRCAQ
jgi:hypothetical protein